MTAIGHRIRSRREALGRSQSDIAGSCGLAPAVVSHYETGRREPSLEALRLLACALHCKAGDLIDDIEVPPMVVCPTCAGHGAIPAPVAERISRDVAELAITRVLALRPRAEVADG